MISINQPVKYKKFMEKMISSMIPINCLFELTYKCNLRCVHCYIVKDRRREISTRQAFGILRQLKGAGCLYVIFSGGEILARDDFFEIARYARKLNFALRLFTNGTLITSKVADKIQMLHPLVVEISLYGLENAHEKITHVKGSFHRTINAIKLLKDRDVKVVVKSSLLRQNVHDIWRLNRFVTEKLGAETLSEGGCLILAPCDNGEKSPLSYRLTGQQLKQYVAEEFKQLKQIGKNFRPINIKHNDILCGSGLISCNVTPYGEVNPCAQIRLKTGNNIKNAPFLTIWNENKEINKIRNLRIRDRKGCSSCKLISYCTYCPGIALSEKGSLCVKSQEFCRIARIRKETYDSLLPVHDIPTSRTLTSEIAEKA